VISDWLPALAAGAGTAAGGLASWIVARRLSSGSTRTSDAGVIWDASEALRHDLTAALKAQGDELTAVKVNLKAQSDELAAVNSHLAVVVADLVTIRAENSRLADEVAILRRTLER